MKFTSFYRANFHTTKNLFRLNIRMRDYARAGQELFAQRLLIYTVAFILEAFYYSWVLAVLSMLVLVVSEIFDHVTFRRIHAMKPRDVLAIRANFRMLQIGTVLSAVNISGFAISIALLQGHTTHFMSLFFLLAAALFAVMNNYQIKSILHLRLAIYIAAFLFIPIYDIVMISAPIMSEHWVQLFTSVFVICFIVDCSRVSRGLYRKTLMQMEAIEREHDMVLAASTAKSDFLSTVSHELRTPLTSIKGSLDLIALGAYGKIPERMEGAINIAQRNAGRLHALINDLLDLQKMEAGRMQFSFETVQLAPFLMQTVATNEPFAAKLEVNLILDSVPDSLYVRADSLRLDQVLSNILSNAAKFSEAGGDVRIRVKADEDSARILVVDQGTGLSEEDRSKVFDEFSQLDSSDRRKVGGTGLGMNISKRIVEAHAGTLNYFKNTGPGTTFYVDLPLVEADNLPKIVETVSAATDRSLTPETSLP
ncbi:sensor histidine kinase [Roseovarius spongiae]|uniref:histidine kinase n=1 Tax=Roseovarius spongiae TaxID=2320272 RepID=A0A3A8B8X6_9RHOB|nr:HAMP domain-containing sensor histidine kinase [Roseovarius spongiae]RKF14188.1 sensor histidine kinase [Roseovarius spongiae]